MEFGELGILLIARCNVFTRRGDQDRFQVFDSALAGRIKPADSLDLVPEEVQTDRQLFGGRPQIHDAAAAGELARLKDGIYTLVADLHPRARQRVWLSSLSSSESAACLEEVAARYCTRHQGASRGHEDGRHFRLLRERQMVGSQCHERLQALPARGHAPGSLLIEQGIRLRKVVARRLDPETELVE